MVIEMYTLYWLLVDARDRSNHRTIPSEFLSSPNTIRSNDKERTDSYCQRDDGA
jgi:hypothetical protein